MMRKKILVISLLALVAALLFPAISAKVGAAINPGIPGGPPPGPPPEGEGANYVCGTVAALYQFSLMIAGILAMGAIVYGGFKYTLSAGNPGGQSEGKDWMKGALLGLLFLVSATVILNTINPEITKCKLPNLQGLPKPPPPPPPGSVSCAVTTNDPFAGKVCTNNTVTDCSKCTVEAQCNGQPNCTVSCGRCPNTYNCVADAPPLQGHCNPDAGACQNSLADNNAISCINSGKLSGNITVTWQGAHHCTLPPDKLSISCHFGGTSCKDGSHAFDVVKPGSMTWSQAITEAQKCASSCFCERRDSTRWDCSDPFINHIHCNVGSCGCN